MNGPGERDQLLRQFLAEVQSALMAGAHPGCQALRGGTGDGQFEDRLTDVTFLGSPRAYDEVGPPTVALPCRYCWDMRVAIDGTLRLSPTDLANHLACPHLTNLELRVAASASSCGRTWTTRTATSSGARATSTRRRTWRGS